MTIVLSPLDVALADARRLKAHFPSALLVEGAIVCRICGVIWRSAPEWAMDTQVCPGGPR